MITKEEKKAYHKAWRKSNPEKVITNHLKHSMIKSGWPIELITPEIIQLKQIILKTQRYES